MQTGAATVDNNMEFPQKIKNRTAFWPSDPTAVNICRIPKHQIERIYAPYVHSSAIYNSQWIETAHMPTRRWGSKKMLWYIYTMGYYTIVKKNKTKKELLLFVTAWMDLEIIMLSEISQSEKDKYHKISLMYGIQWTK